MIKLFKIQNANRFEKLVKNSKGSVIVCFENGQECDLKENAAALEMLKEMDINKDGIQIRLTDASDFGSFVHYMIAG